MRRALFITGSGAALGLGALLLRVALTGVPGAQVLLSPLFWAGAALSFLGFLVMQHALSESHAALVMPALSGISVVVSVGLGALLLGEAFTALQAAGIALIVAGAAGASR